VTRRIKPDQKTVEPTPHLQNQGKKMISVPVIYLPKGPDHSL